MSEVEYRTFIGFIVIPPAAGGQPYTRKAGDKTISTYLFSVPTLNGTDKLINLDFWEGTQIPDCVRDKAALIVTGKYVNQTYENKDGEEVNKSVVTPNRMVPLGDNVMDAPAKSSFTNTAGAPKKRKTAVVDDSVDFDF